MKWLSSEKPVPGQTSLIKLGKHGNYLVPFHILWNSRIWNYPTTLDKISHNPLINSPIHR